MTAYTTSNSVPLSALPTSSGVTQQFLVSSSNTGASTFAPDGLAAVPIFGLGGAALQGGEIITGGVATLVSYVGSLLNSGSLCWVLVNCTGSAVQVAPATASLQAVQFIQLTGVVGTMRNAKMSVPTASASGTFIADEIIVETTLGGLQYKLSSYSKTINLATTGSGGMDTGTAPVSGYVALYAIYNPTSATTNILATNATSAIAPNVYGGANMPSGYTASALISVVPTNASSQFAPFSQIDRHVDVSFVMVLSGGGATVPTPVSLAAVVPKNAVMWGGFGVSDRASGEFGLSPAGTSLGQIQIGSSSGAVTASIAGMRIVTPQTTYYSAVVAAIYLTASSYDF